MRNVYSCEYCTATFLDAKKCNDHELRCESKPLVCPKVTYIKHPKNPDNLFDEYFHFYPEEKAKFHQHKTSFKFELQRDGLVFQHSSAGFRISLNPKSKDKFLSDEKFEFDEYFEYWHCYGGQQHDESFSADRQILKQIFSHRTLWVADNRQVIPNILNLCNYFDFGKYKLEVIYSNNIKIIFDKFTHNNQWGSWCEIQLFPGNDIIEFRIIEKYLNPESIPYKIQFNHFVTGCGFVENILVGSNKCRQCNHYIRQKGENVFCNYKQDVEEI